MEISRGDLPQPGLLCGTAGGLLFHQGRFSQPSLQRDGWARRSLRHRSPLRKSAEETCGEELSRERHSAFDAFIGKRPTQKDELHPTESPAVGRRAPTKSWA